MIFMMFEFTQTTQVWVHYSKSFSRVKSTQDEKVRFIKGIELKLTQFELLSLIFLREFNVIRNVSGNQVIFIGNSTK